MTLHVPKTSYGKNEPIEMTIKVTNKNIFPVVNERSDAQKADFWANLHDGSARLQWVWSVGKLFTQSAQREEFPPMSETTETIVWNREMCSPKGSSEATYNPPFRPTGPFQIQAYWASGTGGWYTQPITVTNT